MERRSVLKTTLALLGTTTLLSLGYPVLRFLSPAARGGSGEKLTIGKEEIPPGSAKELVFEGTPIMLINRRETGFIALSRICTHLGCLVGFDKYQGQLVCPCHAGVFDLDGQMIAGPGSEPLRQFPLTISATHVTVG